MEKRKKNVSLISYKSKPESVQFCFLPVVTSADLIAAGLQVGWIPLRRATMPEIWGQAMEVPESSLKFSGDAMFRGESSELEEEAGDQEASISTPGAAMSG